jgi:hypothetical protein
VQLVDSKSDSKFTILANILSLSSPWASTDFYPGDGKKIPGGGRGAKNNTNFLKKKSKNMLFLAGREEQEPPYPSLPDAYGRLPLQKTHINVFYEKICTLNQTSKDYLVVL